MNVEIKKSLLGARHASVLELPSAIWPVTNHQNMGLISVDRKTSLLSRLQYPVPYQSRLQRIYRSQCPKCDEYGVGPEPIATRNTGEQNIVAFQHGF